ncbi:response regulator transcription factor [Proteiniphilum sp. X52]|uniref:helix-turn-helix transcriptional regulator n=1 Tax=Proteiniphilum sp. X52 TaxID=2382159 RepID=UPI000F09C413|nr:response regulator transcription factor [Proteiniphilum sp. X52]RNC67019.1 DNA-binding response regulator [Proteiniphilum sp. X52]
MRTYIIADNQDITREGVISVLRSQDMKNRVETARSRSELQARLRSYPESVVILDYTLFDFVSVNQLLNMKMGAKASSWILFSDELEERFLHQILLIDPSISVVMKHNPLQNIRDAITCATYGETYLCDIAESVLKDGNLRKKESDTLTPSEKSILREIALGKTTKEIAFEKHLSFHTVNTHRRNIFRKLAVNNAHEATKYALQAGLLDLMEYYI